jgi:UDP-2,3-diacylglucosamine hydrolase
VAALFISDLHLHPDRPAATQRLRTFLEANAGSANTIYILGDLFDAWLGDDLASEHDLEVLADLARLRAVGTPVHFMRGNRDFLVGRTFQGSVAILPDEHVIELDGERVLLMHGDSLCTDDRGYQRYRRLVHLPAMQKAFLGLPGRLRHEIGGFARRKSMAANAGKPPFIMDVNQDAVRAAMKRHGAQTLIHGHVHRPGIHEVALASGTGRRCVLGDWYSSGSVLRWSHDGPQLLPLGSSLSC